MLMLPQWDRVYFGNVCHPQGSVELETIVRAYIPSRETSLLKIIELKEKIGQDGLDLLWELLSINPNQRITAEAALSHQFFQSIRDDINP